MEQQFSGVAVAVVPLPAQGHLNQLLHLSRRISARGITVYFLATATHSRQAKLRAAHAGGGAAHAANFHFHEFPAIPHQNPPPNPSGPTKFPSQIVPALTAATLLRRPVFEFLQNLSRNFRKVVVIYDALMTYVVQDLGEIPNAECYVFRSISAFTDCAWNAGALPEFPDGGGAAVKEVPSMDGYYSPEFGEFLELQNGAKTISVVGEIYNSNAVIEGPFLEFLRKWKFGGGIWGLGPFHPWSSQLRNLRNSDTCLSWLDKQAAPESVIYVSFGTTVTFSDEQIREIAAGLRQSGQSFLWALRDADRGDIFSGEERRAALPEGFEHLVGEKGLVVRDWVPQVEVLAHRSTGGFLSHCGWNSCVESITAGVPMLTWPAHSDQPGNAVLVTKVLGVGVELKAWTRREELVPAAAVERAVRELMGSDGGDLLRRRAAELGKAVRESAVGGEDMELFVRRITTL
ncbi:zeatin O-xylosyltransferase-like [Andrographis paniculata]|uniref:zeatin O-xylosyltransferase-like n=1 Tax=Andrographis paniculata TaxID=175694 RepID=UPI0021E72299|nr:zeatin O-xylosyltransferase-like [Andrographis paniculata]